MNTKSIGSELAARIGRYRDTRRTFRHLQVRCTVPRLSASSKDEVVLVSEDGTAWGLPGGRPEGDEDWRQTLEREVLEEACARVQHARLLGFSRGVCHSGPEKGLVLVRAFWVSTVTVDDWEPQFEMKERAFLSVAEARVGLQAGNIDPVWLSFFNEAVRDVKGG